MAKMEKAEERKVLAPGQPAQNRKKLSEYGIQLREKQKVKRTYGMREKQFRIYFDKATRSKEVTGTVMLQLLEKRLDNVVYRLGIASTRKEARQIVNHAQITVNGKTVNIPSYQVSVGDVIAVKENKKELEMFKQLKGMRIVVPKWLEFNTDTLTGKVLAIPTREEMDQTFQEHLIIELYSR